MSSLHLPGVESRPGWVDTDVGGVRARVVPLGLACCAVEVAAGLDGLDQVGSGEPDCHVLVVAGTVTHAIAADVRTVWDALPEPRVAVAFGACTISGGPYWDSYSVQPGLAEVLTASVVVSGCPPGPDTLSAAVAQAVATLGSDRGSRGVEDA